MAYEVFKKTGTRVESPTLSITPDGRIAINAAAVRILVAQGIRSVLLLWDRSTQTMALKGIQKSDKNAYTVSISSGNHSGSLRAKQFFNYIGWNGRKRESVPAGWNEREKMLEAKLPPEHLGTRKSGI
jgi:hypothetical protein